MQRMIVALLFICFMGWICPKQVVAAENSFETILKDGFYGGLAGTLVGTATLAFTDDPSDHLNHIAYGAAIGVIVGTIVGVVQTSKSMVELENGRVMVGLPVPETRIVSGLLGSSKTEVNVSFFDWHF